MKDSTAGYLERFWRCEGIPLLERLIRVRSVSPNFDPDWERRGSLGEAVDLVQRWSTGGLVDGIQSLVSQEKGRTPALLLTIRGSGPGRVLLYGHLDKQPEFDGWRPGLGPWEPVLDGDRLYGRGGVDDGYAACAALGALELLRGTGRPHPNCLVLLECSEESGSMDLPYHLERLRWRIGRPDLVVALDSEAGDYDHLWTTSSLRGTVVGTLTVRILTEGVHSGAAGGMVPSTFRIARHLLDRIEEAATGELAGFLAVPIPRNRMAEAESTARILGSTIPGKFPWTDGARPMSDDLAALLVNNTWRSCVSVTGAGGLPALQAAGSTHRPSTSLKLCVRIPPTLDAGVAARRLEEVLEREPPYGATVAFEVESAASGWNAPETPAWMERSTSHASMEWFGNSAASMGTGGTIPFVEMLGSRFPDAAFLVTGVAGPHSNAHGPNEFLHLPAARKLTGCLAGILGDAAGNLSDDRR
jgi:acetylornithine deacetylase/succinyl-diaminopimelate desuccinylase-like protein